MYKVYVSIFSIKLNDNYIAEYSGVEHETREDAEKELREALKDNETAFIR